MSAWETLNHHAAHGVSAKMKLQKNGNFFGGRISAIRRRFIIISLKSCSSIRNKLKQTAYLLYINYLLRFVSPVPKLTRQTSSWSDCRERLGGSTRALPVKHMASVSSLHCVAWPRMRPKHSNNQIWCSLGQLGALWWSPLFVLYTRTLGFSAEYVLGQLTN